MVLKGDRGGWWFGSGGRRGVKFQEGGRGLTLCKE